MKFRQILKETLRIGEFGAEHPELLDSLSLSLQRYEYQLYAKYSYTPKIGKLQWGNYLKGTVGSRYYYYFIFSPHKLPKLQACLDKKKIPQSISLGGWSAYEGFINLYTALLYYLAISNSSEYEYWRDSKYAKYDEKMISNAEQLKSKNVR